MSFLPGHTKVVNKPLKCQPSPPPGAVASGCQLQSQRTVHKTTLTSHINGEYGGSQDCPYVQ